MATINNRLSNGFAPLDRVEDATNVAHLPQQTDAMHTIIIARVIIPAWCELKTSHLAIDREIQKLLKIDNNRYDPINGWTWFDTVTNRWLANSPLDRGWSLVRHSKSCANSHAHFGGHVLQRMSLENVGLTDQLHFYLDQP